MTHFPPARAESYKYGETVVQHMICSNSDIKRRIESGNLVIDPYVEEHVEPASIDLRLGDHFVRYTDYHEGDGVLDLKDGFDALDGREDDWGTYDSYVIHPDDFVLATTEEYVEIPNDLLGKVDGRSSIGRLGVEVHRTAGIIDPGYEGEITLEITNAAPFPIRVHAGQRVCQMLLMELTEPATVEYGDDNGNQYKHQEGATVSGMSFESRE